MSQYDATDFRRGCNRWIGLGVYHINANQNVVVRIEDQTDETGLGHAYKLVVDAVKVDKIVLTKDPNHDENITQTNAVPYIFDGDDSSEDDE